MGLFAGQLERKQDTLTGNNMKKQNLSSWSSANHKCFRQKGNKTDNKTALETFKGTQYGKHNIKETEGQICAFAFCINIHFPVHQYKKILYSEGQQPWNHPQWSAFSHQWMDQASMWISVDVGLTSLPDNSSYFQMSRMRRDVAMAPKAEFGFISKFGS